MQILVVLLTGGTHSLEVEPETPVDEVRDVVSKLLFPMSTPSEVRCLVRMVFAGKQLEDGRTLFAYNVQQESTIHVIPKIRGS